jgi:6-pyruvoyltetrahydropterin/6-carboxytetrahydropterin synthase
MFEISVKRTFAASHALRDADGLVEEPHDHEWSCEVTLASEGTDGIGTVADFRDVDRALDSAIDPIVGKGLHETRAFEGMSPSAENVALFIYRRLKDELGEKLRRVRVWEDADHSATYYE